MREYYNIKEVAKLLQTPMSTLRYWDDEGVIHTERDSGNNYRKFSMAAIMELSTVSFYRSLGIPVKEVKQMMESDVKIQKSILEGEEDKVERQIQNMYEQRSRIRQQKFLLEEVERLKACGISTGIPAFPAAVSFENENKEHWESTMQNPEKFVLVLDVHDSKNVSYAVGTKETKGKHVLWKQQETAVYAECLLTALNTDERKNNLDECLKQVRRAGMYPIEAAAQYLTSEWNGQLVDYYKLWLCVEV